MSRRRKLNDDDYINKIKEIIGADSLHYQTINDLEKAIGLKSDLCKACLNGSYPLKSVGKITELEQSIKASRFLKSSNRS